METGINIYKRTGQNESQARMVPDRHGGLSANSSFKGGRLYQVPLHEDDQQYDDVSTGLVHVQPDMWGPGLVKYVTQFYDPAYPWRMSYPNHSRFNSINGCPLSMNANRSYYLGVGEYFLESMDAGFGESCSYFNVKMTCSSGGQTADPEASDPLGFSVDPQSGAITGTPQKVRNGYNMRLRAVDAADVRADIAEWRFNVQPSPEFKLNPSSGWSMETDNDGRLSSKYHVDETHLLPKPRLNKTSLLQHPANGDFSKVVYLLSAKAEGDNPNCAATKIISALTDVATGEGAINIQCEGSYSATLVVRDGAGAEVTVRSWNFTARRRDTTVAAYGPNGLGCANGDPVDGEPMDGAFTCDCDGTKFTDDNCETPGAVQGETTAAVVGALVGALALAAAIVVLLLRWQRHKRSMMATDFLEQLDAMKERGELDEAQASTGGVPRELKRGWLSLIDTLGKGAFGEVWKGLLQDGGNPNIPSYMVAAKVVKEASGSLDSAGAAAAEEELLKEALLMAQVKTHPHLVSLVGVVTRGNPKVLVLSFCEHGELQGALKQRAADGDAFSDTAKCDFCKEVADGMAHLALHNFVHRDLAARNVLLGSGMVCKVADFGLSRRVQTEDNTGDYYRSSSGIIPVRWTAPEGITSQKFSSASDVWSYGSTCVEIFLDGARPYPGIASNPEVVREYPTVRHCCCGRGTARRACFVRNHG